MTDASDVIENKLNQDHKPYPPVELAAPVDTLFHRVKALLRHYCTHPKRCIGKISWPLTPPPGQRSVSISCPQYHPQP